MGQRWSMLKSGYLDESESEVGDSLSLAHIHQSQATTEASSSVPALDRGWCSVTCPNDIEIDAMVVAFLDRLFKFKIILNNNLSSLQSGEATRDTRSHFSSLKDGSVKGHEAPPCRLSALDHKLEAYREALHGQFATRKLGANYAGVQSQSARSLNVAKWIELAQNDAEEEEIGLLSPYEKLEAVKKVGRKRKRPQPVQVTDASKGAVGTAAAAVLDLGTGVAMVGRCVKKVVQVEGRREHCCTIRGRVASYHAAQRLYQIKYDDGKEEALEWLDLEPYLLARGGRAHTRPRYKTLDELVYLKRKRSGRRVGRR